jgi:hypothetical protein
VTSWTSLSSGSSKSRKSRSSPGGHIGDWHGVISDQSSDNLRSDLRQPIATAPFRSYVATLRSFSHAPSRHAQPCRFSWLRVFTCVNLVLWFVQLVTRIPSSQSAIPRDPMLR